MVSKEYIDKMKSYDIKTLPLYLQISIRDYIKVCEENNMLRMGDYYTDLMSSINCA